MNNDDNSYSRREFLSKGITGITVAGLLGTLTGNVFSYPLQDKKSEAKKEIIYRILGKTGLKIPIVSMGVMNASLPELVKRSYEKGIRYFDTSAYYQRGKNEEMIGDVIKQLNARKEVIIATKVYIPHELRSMSPEHAKAYYLKTAEESLKRLQTDYVDILHSHSVNELTWLNNPGILEALQLLKKQGKIRFIGFSTHMNMAECINDATKSGLYDVILTMFNYTLWDDQNLLTALKNAHAKKIGLIAMKTQCPQYGGHWKDVPNSKLHYYEGTMMHTAVLKWVLRHPFITTAIPGFTTFQQIEDDYPVTYNLDYTDEEKEFLNDRNVSLSFGYCRQCSECTRQCKMGVDIPTLMRVHMYSVCYNNFHHARQTLNDVPISKSLRNCDSCNQCSVHCKYGINIANRIKELQAIYG
jgi:predicted aldo/keto reductase-like oxidoreductase